MRLELFCDHSIWPLTVQLEYSIILFLVMHIYTIRILKLSDDHFMYNTIFQFIRHENATV